MANAIRFLSMDAIERAGDGHPGTPLGSADTVTALFAHHLKFNPKDPLWFDRDRVVLSNGHGSMLLYSLLYLSGYDTIGIDQVSSFRELGSHCEGHPEIDPSCGIETTTGPLGQGIANAAGMAVAEAFLNSWLGPDIVDHRTYAMVGDGCLQEGLGQEIISLAGHLRLGKLTFLWDDNKMTDDGVIDIASRDDMPARFRLSGWHVQEVDGHDAEAVSAALLLAKKDPRPSMIACATIIGRGLPKIEGTRAAHSSRLHRELTDAARRYLDWPHPAFVVPDDILAAWRDTGKRSAADYAAWQARAEALPADKKRLLARLQEGRLPEGWDKPLRDFKAQAQKERKPQYGITLSSDLVDMLSDAIPELVSGAPDLEGATQHKRRLKPFGAADPGGRYVHYGIREHAMGAMLNGMAAHGGVVPVGVTYLVFSDYMRPTLRLAAMMKLPVQFVFSHDSIGIGRNGPTHQPVEYLASLRAIPNMLTLRPADAVEAAECWEIALANRDGPSALIFARQPLQPVRGGRGPRTCRAAAPMCWPRPAAAPGAPPSSPPARRWRWPWRRASCCRASACRLRWCRCRAGRCSRRRTRPTAPASSAAARPASASRRRCGSAGTAISARTAASSACAATAPPAPRTSSTPISASPRRTSPPRCAQAVSRRGPFLSLGEKVSPQATDEGQRWAPRREPRGTTPVPGSGTPSGASRHLLPEERGVTRAVPSPTADCHPFPHSAIPPTGYVAPPNRQGRRHAKDRLSRPFHHRPAGDAAPPVLPPHLRRAPAHRAGRGAGATGRRRGGHRQQGRPARPAAGQAARIEADRRGRHRHRLRRQGLLRRARHRRGQYPRLCPAHGAGAYVRPDAGAAPQRRVPYREDTLNGEWQKAGQFFFFNHPIQDLGGARLGIIGEGVLGQRVAELGKAFGMVTLFAAHKGVAAWGRSDTPWDECWKRATSSPCTAR